LSNTLAKLLNAYPNWNWQMDMLSRNPSLTMEFVDEHLDLRWNMCKLSGNGFNYVKKKEIATKRNKIYPMLSSFVIPAIANIICNYIT
jgi:hypothetical protein